MQIHVVTPGQSLYEIAQAYGTTVTELANVNEQSLEQPLVIGQALVVPVSTESYTVQPGDSLYSIAQAFGTSVQSLADANTIPVNQPLTIGQQLVIPQTEKTIIESNAYIEPFGEAVSEALSLAAQDASPLLTYLAPFSYRLNHDGSLSAPPLGNLRAIANQNNAVLMMVITNLEEGQFSAELGSAILNDEAVQNQLLDNIVQTAQTNGFVDIHFDLEFLLPEDREAYNQFLRKAADRLHNEGLLISTALAPKTSAEQTGPWYTAHDYRAHGEIVDFVVIMTYEWGYSGGPPMPVSPIGPVREVLEYALTEIPAEKIMMGQNLYGYDWTLPYTPGGEYARALSPQAAIALAQENNAAIEYDESAQAPFFHYWDEAGSEHVVWFEDARSILAKFDLLQALNLRGISYWKLGLSFPQNWLLLDSNFRIAKK